MNVFNASILREVDDDVVEVYVTAQYSPSTPHVFYLPNGDPGYPGDPEEVEIISAETADGTPVELTEAEYDLILVDVRDQYREGPDDYDGDIPDYWEDNF